jgi:hypothetical protein
MGILQIPTNKDEVHMSIRPDFVEALISKNLFLLAMVFEKIDDNHIDVLKYSIMESTGIDLGNITKLYHLASDDVKVLKNFELTRKDQLITYVDNKMRNEAELRKLLEERKGIENSIRWKYYLGIVLVLFSLGYVFALTFFEIPATNQRFADAFGGLLVGCVFQTVLSFFFNGNTKDNPYLSKLTGKINITSDNK